MRSIPILLLAVWAVSAKAQTAGVPRLGWVIEEGGAAVREAVGIPGAAQSGPNREIPGVRMLAIRPGSGTALAVREDGQPVAVDLDSLAAGSAHELEGAVQRPDLAVWSPLGKALLLCSYSESRLQVWLQQGEGWRLERESALGAESAAVSDRGEVLARIDGVLYFLGTDGSMEEITREPGSRFTFLAGSGRYAWLEAGAARLAGESGAMVEIPLTEKDGVARLLFSPVRGMLVVAESRDDRTELTSWSGEGLKQGEWICPATVMGITASGADGVVQLVVPGDGPAWMASFDQSGGRVFFVPRPAAEGGDLK